ncbi:MAG TPA: tetratricopeptide repeat protein [Thermoanaerobaculia bacterium]|nr:tetratricopeptide repeat protein [Thermoanaerobaculia bacterium]
MAIQRDKIIASAEKLVAKGKIEPAIKEYERLLDDNPSDVNTLNRIGDLWVRINRNDEAVKVFGRIADHYSRDGFFLKAIAIYKKINKLDPSKLDIYAKLADLYGKQGLAMEAKSQYQVLADYYLKHGDPGNALAIYRKISELDPNSINVHVKLADLYSQNNQTKDALKEYDRVGRMLLKRGMLDEAVQVFKKALKIDSSNIELVESLVTALVEAKDYDNAIQIVQTSLESAPDNARLLSIHGRILLAKGDTPGARATLERALARDANDVSVREALADLYLRIGNTDGALEMLSTIAEKALGRGERGTAVEALSRILRVDPGHAPTLERLVALYSRLNEETNILSAMSSLAEAHVASGRFENAAEVLEKLIQREPQNAQHRTKLQFVRTQIGGNDTMPARPPQPEAPAAPLSMEIDEPVPSFDSFDEGPTFSLDLDASEPLELDLNADLDSGFEPPPPAPPPIAPPPPPPPATRTPTLSRMQSAVELAAADLDAEDGGEDLDFITEHLTEAEVFAKYGLTEKATEHLRAIIERAPRHLGAHEKLYRLLLDDGDVDGARAAANQYMVILHEKDDTAAIANIQDEFMMRGHSLLPPAPKLPEPVAPTMERAIAEPVEIEEELSFDLDSGALEFDMPAIEPEPAFSFDAPHPEPEPAATPLSFESEPALTFDEPAIEELSFDAAIDQQFEQPVFAPQPFVDAPSAEELRELDFYIEQELFDEARQKLDSLAVLFPANSAVADRRTRYDAAMASITAAPSPAPDAFAPAVLSRDEIESELLSALPDDDEDFFTPPPPPPPRAAAPPPPPPVHEENLFADEDDFFDLAAELESELEDESEEVSLSEEEQSLEEIFKEFKKGVEQQLDSEDYDTHYNLGIAYKEMGLIDEAIGEFQLASKDPMRAVECASMLGLCFLEKGMPQLAIKWYRKGLEMPEITKEEHVGLLYDLGSAYVEVGDTENAQKAFVEVYSLNTNYRDIVTRIKQLEDVRP